MLNWFLDKMESIRVTILLFVSGIFFASSVFSQINIQFVNLKNHETIRNNNAIEYTVQAKSSEPLTANDVVQLQVAQQNINCMIVQMNINCTLKGIARGEHRMQLNLIRQQKIVASSESLVVYFQQNHL